VQALREKLLAEVDSSSRIDARGLKPHQVHELAAAKMGMYFIFFPESPCSARLTGNSGERTAAECPRHLEGLRRG
jgi:hypothetical protein